MTNTFMGRSQINECPHKTVSRFYQSAEACLWKCDWCGQEFRAVDGEPARKMVDLNEIAEKLSNTPSTNQFAMRASVSGTAHGSDVNTSTGTDSASQVEALSDRSTAPNKRLRRV